LLVEGAFFMLTIVLLEATDYCCLDYYEVCLCAPASKKVPRGREVNVACSSGPRWSIVLNYEASTSLSRGCKNEYIFF